MHVSDEVNIRSTNQTQLSGNGLSSSLCLAWKADLKSNKSEKHKDRFLHASMCTICVLGSCDSHVYGVCVVCV